MDEEWKVVPAYEGHYSVSSLGRIRSEARTVDCYGGTRDKTERILKPHNIPNGYQQVTLFKNNQRKIVLIHRVVAEAFLPNPESLPQVNHKNGVRNDNRLENLEWVTMSENIVHRRKVLNHNGGRQKSVVCIETGVKYASAKEAAEAIGCSRTRVSSVCKSGQGTANKLHFIYGGN